MATFEPYTGKSNGEGQAVGWLNGDYITADALNAIDQALIDVSTAVANAQEHYVRFDEAQELSDDEKERARENIDALSANDLNDSLDKIVSVTEQNFTIAEQAQARENIHAANVSIESLVNRDEEDIFTNLFQDGDTYPNGVPTGGVGATYGKLVYSTDTESFIYTLDKNEASTIAYEGYIIYDSLLPSNLKPGFDYELFWDLEAYDKTTTGFWTSASLHVQFYSADIIDETGMVTPGSRIATATFSVTNTIIKRYFCVPENAAIIRIMIVWNFQPNKIMAVTLPRPQCYTVREKDKILINARPTPFTKINNYNYRSPWLDNNNKNWYWSLPSHLNLNLGYTTVTGSATYTNPVSRTFDSPQDAINTLKLLADTIDKFYFNVTEKKGHFSLRDKYLLNEGIKFDFTRTSPETTTCELENAILTDSSDAYDKTWLIPVYANEVIQYHAAMKDAAQYMRFFSDNDFTNPYQTWVGTSSGKITTYNGTWIAPVNGWVELCSRKEDTGFITVYPSMDSYREHKSTTAYEGTTRYSILAAKEQMFNDVANPVIDWYLLIDPLSNDFYASKDLKSKRWLFTWSGANNDPHRYKYGILPNGDIIAVYRTEFEDKHTNLSNPASFDADVRKNPYVFLASENYETAHEVNFSGAIPPSGWLQNVGFVVLPNGDALFAEYTRIATTYTSNCWCIRNGADITTKDGWEITLQLHTAITDPDESTEIPDSEYENDEIEHFHALSYDPFGHLIWLTTGDLRAKARFYYFSEAEWKDRDELAWTWERFSFQDSDGNPISAGQKQFRLLNITWTPDAAYWISDTASDKRGVIKCTRQNNGLLDPQGITYLIDSIPATTPSYPATYGQVYLPEEHLLVMMERCDEKGAESLTFRAFDMDSNVLKTITTFKPIPHEVAETDSTYKINTYLGFRTEYTEYNPTDGIIKCGFGGRWEYRNRFNFFNNVVSSTWSDMVNNLWIKVWKNNNVGGTLSYQIGTYKF